MPSKLSVVISLQQLYNYGIDKKTSISQIENAIRIHHIHENQADYRTEGGQGCFMPV